MKKLMHLTTVDMSLELLLGHQLRAARHAGYEVVGVSAPGPWTVGLAAEGIRHIPLPSSTRGWNPTADLRSVKEFWRILRRERPTILHTHNPKPGLYGRVLGRLAGVPIVINTVHGLYAAPDDPLLKRAVVYLLEAIASRFSDQELVQSAEDVAVMKRFRLARPARITHLGNGVDLASYDPALVSEPSHAGLREDLGIPSGMPIVGMVGRLVAEKGWPEFFEAVNELRRQGLAFAALAIGPADTNKADAVTADQMREAEQNGVVFLGLRHDMRDLYGLMDIFVLPSHREGFPRAAMEAAAMGVPLVASDIRGCREVVEHGVNGFLVPVRSGPDLARSIRTLLENEQLRLRMGRAGREIAAARFGADQVASTVLDTYRAVAHRKGIDLWRATGVQSADEKDAPTIARLHARGIPTGFLSTLGPGVLAELYRGLVLDPTSLVLVDRGANGEVKGFIAGSRNTRAAYRSLLKSRGPALALSALAATGARPRRMRKALETLRYSSRTSRDLPVAELLAMAVEKHFRSQGLGAGLVSEFLSRLDEPAVRVVVAADNTGAIRFYRAQGFQLAEEIEVHSGQHSKVLVWNSSSPS